jgi:hypothetical protein
MNVRRLAYFFAFKSRLRVSQAGLNTRSAGEPHECWSIFFLVEDRP